LSILANCLGGTVKSLAVQANGSIIQAFFDNAETFYRIIQEKMPQRPSSEPECWSKKGGEWVLKRACCRKWLNISRYGVESSVSV
jgi:hypothetical protein